MGTLKQRMTKNGQIFPFPEPGRLAEKILPAFRGSARGNAYDGQYASSGTESLSGRGRRSGLSSYRTLFPVRENTAGRSKENGQTGRFSGGNRGPSRWRSVT